MAATDQQVTEWDAQGNPISGGHADAAPTEWDAQGNRISGSSAKGSGPDLTDNPNGEGLYQMRSPAGQTISVPYSKVVDARNQGHQFANDAEQGRFNKDYAADPARQGEPGFSAPPTLGQRLKSALTHPLNSMEAAAQPISRPHDATAAEMAATDLYNAAAGETAVARHPLRTAATVVTAPVEAALHPAETFQQLNEGGPEAGAYMLGQGLATAGAAKALPELPAAMGAAKSDLASQKIPLLSKWARNRTPVPEENFTPQHAQAHAAVIAEGNAAGDTGYIPNNIAQSTTSKVRQIAADNKPLVTAIKEGSPEDALAAHQAILDKAKREIDVRHNAALSPLADSPVDMTPVQKAIQPSKYELEGMDPSDASAIKDLQQRAGQIKTLRGLNEFRQQLSTEDSTLRNPMAQGKSALYPQAVRKLYGAVRDAYYQALEGATGQDFQGDKRLEGSIIQEQRGLLNASPRLAAAEARESASKGFLGNAADVVEGKGSTSSGIPIIGGVANKFADALRGTKLKQIQRQLRTLYSDLPAESAPPAPPSFARPQLPPPQDSDAPFTVENAGHGPEIDPGSTAGVPVPQPVPATVTPAPAPTMQLPAQAGPEGSGIPPGPDTNPPPPVNEATARTRIQPLPENPQPVPPSPAGFTVGPDGTAQRAPAGALPAPAAKPRAAAPKPKPAMSHPAGDVTGIDEASGLPIVRRRIPAATEPDGGAAPAQAAAAPPVETAQPSLPFDQQRPAIQASANPDELRASAAEQKPVLKDLAEKAVEGVPGAEVEGMRVKDAESVENKADRGKPPETISDHLGARVSAPTPEGVEQVKQNVESQLPVTDADKITNNGLNADQYTVQTGKPGEPNQQSELQVVTKPQAEAMKATDGLYEKQKEAEAKGDTEKAASLGERIKKHFEKAKADVTGTSNDVAKQEKPAGEPRYKFGNTQHNIAADSEASKSLEQARARIKPEDLAGDGKDIGAGGNHVTVRYGIQDDDTSGIKSFLEKQTPFDARLGPIDSFPPTKNSDGAAVLVAPVESPELHLLNAEIQKHGDFKESDFPDYKPHATVAYVKPEAVSKYVGDKTTAGKTFRVDSVSISDRNGNHVDVPLKGNQPGVFAKGDRVTLPDGRTGTVQFYDSKITKNARVKADDGSMVTSVKGSELKPADAAQPGADESHPEAKGDKWIGVDLDGTLASYDGFKGAGHIGEPIGPMLDRVKQWLKDGNNVKILTARVNEDPGGVARSAIEDWTQKHLGQKLPITDVKDQHMVALYDDRAVPVERNTGRLLAQHQPEDAHAQPGNGGGRDAAATPKSGRTETDAVREPEAAGILQRQPQEDRAGSSGRVQPGVQGNGPAETGAAAGKEALGGEGGKQWAGKEVAPNEVGRMSVSDLHLDPRRFQYKLNTDSSGVTNLLKGSKWNDDLSGVVSVWKDPKDGKTYVVNGHHRAQLAKARGVDSIPVRMLDAADANEARSIGALQNIAEGRGTPIDAAKFMRDTGLTLRDLESKGISMGEATAENGVALARLSPKLFDDVVSGKLKQGRAVAIGKATDVPEEQEAILKLIQRRELGGHRVPDDVVEEMARMAKSAGTHIDTQQTLFGAEEMRRNLALEKAEVSAFVRHQIQQEKRLFGSVSDENKAERLGKAGNKIDAAKNAEIAQQAAQAHELYDKLSTRSGEIDDILNEAASGLAKGKAGVKADAYERIRESLSKALSGSQGPGSGAVQEEPPGPSLFGDSGKG
jgi:2'-5' RNA ligase